MQHNGTSVALEKVRERRILVRLRLGPRAANPIRGGKDRHPPAPMGSARSIRGEANERMRAVFQNTSAY